MWETLIVPLLPVWEQCGLGASSILSLLGPVLVAGGDQWREPSSVLVNVCMLCWFPRNFEDTAAAGFGGVA